MVAFVQNLIPFLPVIVIGAVAAVGYHCWGRA